MSVISQLKAIRLLWLRNHYPNISKTSRISRNVTVFNPQNLYMEENTNINPGAVIMNSDAKFILKKGSGSAYGLLVSTGNHMFVPGYTLKQITQEIKEKLDLHNEYNKDVIVDEDVHLATKVTLLCGVHVSRGAIVGSGSVVRNNIPPYAMVVGNPAKIVGFRFTPEEIIEHEKKLYPEDERLSLDYLQANYRKYFVSKAKEIKNFVKSSF